MNMREEYDINNLNPRRNPYVKRPRQQVTMNMHSSTVAYFKELAGETGMPYQSLMNLYLDEAAEKKKRPHFE